MRNKYQDDDDYNDGRGLFIICTIVVGVLFYILPQGAHTFLGVSYFFCVLYCGFKLFRGMSRIDRINAGYELIDRRHAEEEARRNAQEAERQHEYFANNWHSSFCTLAEILKTVPDDYPDKRITELPAKLTQIGLDPHADDWQQSKDVFVAKVKPYPLETLNTFAQQTFNREGHGYWDYVLAKEICAFRVAKAPALGLHTYGLPSKELEREHDSLTPAHYLTTPTERFRHTYILGKTGAGKTTLIKNLITQDIMRGDGVILLSPEGALFDFIIKDFPIARAHQLILFDPTDTEPPIVSLNPLHLEDRRDLAREAGAVAGTLGRAMGDDLSGAMQTLLLKCAYTLLQLPNSSFQDVRALLKTVSPLRDSLPTSPHLDDITREYWRDEFDKGGHRRSAEALISRLDAFFMPPLASTLSRSSFALSRALNASRSVFLFDFSRIHGTQQTIIGQLTLSLILQTLLKREAQSEDKRIHYHLYIDEFQTFAENSETAFREMLNRARKYKMSVTLAHQVSSDIPPRLLDTILGNVGTKVCLQLATTDAEFFAKQLHVVGYRPHDAAEKLEKLKKGQAFLSTSHPDQFNALRIDIPAEPLYYGGEAHDENHAHRVRLAAKRNYGNLDIPSPRPDPARPAPPSSSPPKDDEDDGIFT